MNINLTVPLKTPSYIDGAVHKLKNAIHSVIHTIAKSQTPNPSNRWYLPLETQQIITERGRYRARWQRTRYHANKFLTGWPISYHRNKQITNPKRRLLQLSSSFKTDPCCEPQRNAIISKILRHPSKNRMKHGRK